MESYGFFNGDTEYGQDEFNRYFKNIYEDGLSRGSNGSLTSVSYTHLDVYKRQLLGMVRRRLQQQQARKLLLSRWMRITAALELEWP